MAGFVPSEFLTALRVANTPSVSQDALTGVLVPLPAAELRAVAAAFHELAEVIDANESRYMCHPNRSPLADARSSVPSLRACVDLVLDSNHVVERLTSWVAVPSGGDGHRETAAARLLLALVHSSGAVLVEDCVRHACLGKLVLGSNFRRPGTPSGTTEQTSQLPDPLRPTVPGSPFEDLRVYATGLLACALASDRYVADHMVHVHEDEGIAMAVPEFLLRRLRGCLLPTWRESGGVLTNELRYTLQCLAAMGEYQEVLAHALTENAPSIMIEFLDGKPTKGAGSNRSDGGDGGSNGGSGDGTNKAEITESRKQQQRRQRRRRMRPRSESVSTKDQNDGHVTVTNNCGGDSEEEHVDMDALLLQFETLELVSRLLAHKKFANEFVDRAGAEKLMFVALSAARTRPAFLCGSVAWCFACLATLTGTMERVLLERSVIVSNAIHFAVSLLESNSGSIDRDSTATKGSNSNGRSDDGSDSDQNGNNSSSSSSSNSSSRSSNDNVNSGDGYESDDRGDDRSDGRSNDVHDDHDGHGPGSREHSMGPARKSALFFISNSFAFPCVLEMFAKAGGLDVILSALVDLGNRAMRHRHEEIPASQSHMAKNLMRCLHLNFRAHFAVAIDRTMQYVRRRQRQQRQEQQSQQQSPQQPQLQPQPVPQSSETQASKSMMPSGPSERRSRQHPVRSRAFLAHKAIDLDDGAHEANITIFDRFRSTAVPLLQRGFTPMDALVHFGTASTADYQVARSSFESPARGSLQHDDTTRVSGSPADVVNQPREAVRMLLETVLRATGAARFLPSSHATEASCHALQILRIVTLLPAHYELVCACKLRLGLASGTSSEDGTSTNRSDGSPNFLGISALLEAASTAGVTSHDDGDPDVTVSALQVLCNCCSPFQGEDRAQRSVRRLARRHNALIVLLALLTYSKVPRVADRIQFLACLALHGLARDRRIAQILHGLQVASTLSQLIRSEPVLVENVPVHRRLKKAALDLIKVINDGISSNAPHCGDHPRHRSIHQHSSHSNHSRRNRNSPQEQLQHQQQQQQQHQRHHRHQDDSESALVLDVADATENRLNRAAIVAHTQVSFHQIELLELIRRHLDSRGLHAAAAALRDEASLGNSSHQRNEARPFPVPFTWPSQSQACTTARPLRPLITLSSPFTRGPDHRIGITVGPFDSGSKTGLESAITSATSPPPPPPPAAASAASATAATAAAVAAALQRADKSVLRRVLSFALRPRVVDPRTATSPARAASERKHTPRQRKLATLPLAHTTDVARSLSPRLTASKRASLLRTAPTANNSKRVRVGTRANASAPVAGASLPSSLSSAAPLPHHARVSRPQTQLEHIVQDYLRDQHRECARPVCVLPPFSLTDTHHCPTRKADHESDGNHGTPARSTRNAVSRLARAQVEPRWGGRGGRQHTLKLVHSRWRWWRTFSSSADSSDSTAAPAAVTGAAQDGIRLANAPSRFSVVSLWNRQPGCDDEILLGTESGELVRYNVWTSECLKRQVAHDGAVSSIQTRSGGSDGDSRDDVILTVSERRADSQLFRLSSARNNEGHHALVPVHGWDDTVSADLAGSGKSMVAVTGTNESEARLFDLVAGKLVRKFGDAASGSNYLWHRACFSPGDDLVLHDGLLWDARQSSPIVRKSVHKFEKLSTAGQAVFHPSGNQVTINSAVWDLRTYKLLCTCPALDHAVAQFDRLGQVIYSFRPARMRDGASLQMMDRHRQHSAMSRSSFWVTDGGDYSNVAVNDVGVDLHDLSLDASGRYVAVIVGHGDSGGDADVPDDPNESMSESSCRLYEIGRPRPFDYDSDFDDARSESECESDSSEGDSDVFGEGSVDEDDDGDDDDEEDDDDDGDVLRVALGDDDDESDDGQDGELL